jgi:dihydrodipicolinate synthase/N-acetylneuraminate lyase
LTSAIPEICAALWEALERKDYEGAIPLQKKADDFGRAIGRLGQRFGRSAHREAMRARGFKIKRYPRWPSEELTEEAMQTVADALKATGVS